MIREPSRLCEMEAGRSAVKQTIKPVSSPARSIYWTCPGGLACGISRRLVAVRFRRHVPSTPLLGDPGVISCTAGLWPCKIDTDPDGFPCIYTSAYAMTDLMEITGMVKQISALANKPGSKEITISQVRINAILEKKLSI